jgi:hypothetical protein
MLLPFVRERLALPCGIDSIKRDNSAPVKRVSPSEPGLLVDEATGASVGKRIPSRDTLNQGRDVSTPGRASRLPIGDGVTSTPSGGGSFPV